MDNSKNFPDEFQLKTKEDWSVISIVSYPEMLPDLEKMRFFEMWVEIYDKSPIRSVQTYDDTTSYIYLKNKKKYKIQFENEHYFLYEPSTTLSLIRL